MLLAYAKSAREDLSRDDLSALSRRLREAMQGD